MNQRQYLIPGRITETSATIKGLNDTEVVVCTTSPFNTPTSIAQKTDGSWRTAVDYCKINQVVAPIATDVPDVISLFEQINTSRGTWYAATALENACSLIPVHKDHKKQSAFSWQGQQYPFTSLPQGYINFPSLCYNFVWKDFDHTSLLQNVPLIHNADNIVLLGPSEQEVETTLNFLVTHMGSWGWEINLNKILGPSTSVKFLEVHWCGA